MKNKNKWLKLLATVTTIATIATAQTSAIWDGTINTVWYNETDTEFTITTAEQLAGLAEIVNNGNKFIGKTIKLGANIMLNDTTNWQDWENDPPVNEWTRIGYWEDDPDDNLGVYGNKRFEGTFDGCGYIVCGIYINSSDNYQGLFGRIGKNITDYNCDAIKNLGITASYVISNNEYCAGLLAGSADDGKITNCYTAGKVKGNAHVGGFIGDINCHVSNCYSTAEVKGNSLIGGFVGIMTGLEISNCYAKGNVQGYSNVGGFVGLNYEKITNSYSTGKIEGNKLSGGLAGNYDKEETPGTIGNSYYDKETSGKNDNDGRGYPKTTAEMKQQSTFINWDFSSIWAIDATKNDGYPYLRSLGVNDGTSIHKVQRSDNRFGIRFAQNIVNDKAEMTVVLPNNETISQTKLVVFDILGNVVFESEGSKGRSQSPFVWNLTNSVGRIVANGSYLVIAEVKSQSGMKYHYSAKLGVRR